MSANPGQHSGWAGGHQGEPSASATRRLGSPGKYHSVVAVTNITQSFNSESPNYGYGAIMLGDGANIGGTSIDTLDGGKIQGADLLEHHIYEIAPTKVKAKTGTVYVFKVQR